MQDIVASSWPNWSAASDWTYATTQGVARPCWRRPVWRSQAGD